MVKLRRWRTTRNQPTRIPQRVSGAEASWLRRADGGAKTGGRHHSTNKDPHQESGGLTEKLYIWKANPEDNQVSTIKDSSHT
ncbi:unnamed protein product [Boreogadus saida]